MTMTTTPLPVSAIEPIDHRAATPLAEEAYARFADAVEALGEDDWSRPTDCEGWTVRDLVGHVVGAMRSAASVRELASQQLTVLRRTRRGEGNETDVMTALQVERTASLSIPELVAECRRLVPKAAAGRRRTPAPARRFVTARVTLRGGTERWTLGYLVDVILTRDAWLHRVDLARAVGAELRVDAEHDGRIVADVVAEWARRHGRPFELVLTGLAGGSYRSAADVPGDPDRLELDAVEFCRLASGRASGEGLLATEVPF
jgi:uncharacterized protein (TIGR03083 family)